MQTWAYPASLERTGSRDYVVRFLDVPEALTAAASEAEAWALAADALDEAILAYMAAGRDPPAPGKATKGLFLVALDPTTAARAALVQAMRAEKVTNTALASRLGKSEGAVRRLVDGVTEVKINTVIEALGALGRTAALVVD